MVNDLHFWGLRQLDVKPIPAADNGDLAPLVPQGAVVDEGAEEVRALVDLGAGRPQMPAAQVEAELALCHCLRTWDPWSEPSADLVSAISALGALERRGSIYERCMLRSQALEDLLYEMEHAQHLPECMRYNGGARCRLRQQRIAVKSSVKRTQVVMDHLQVPQRMRS